MQAAKDESILARALQEDRIVVSADTDFGTLLAAWEADKPSFILFRNPDLVTAEDYAAVLISNIPMLQPELQSGCVDVFRSGRL
jgi:predicted nuclease of predicted toxin-antitoxin system